MSRKLVQTVLLLCCVGISVVALVAASLFRNDHTKEIFKELYPNLPSKEVDIKNVKVTYQNEIGRKRHGFVSFDIVPKENYYTYWKEQLGNLQVYRVSKVSYENKVTDYEFAIKNWKYEPVSKLQPIYSSNWITQKALDVINNNVNSGSIKNIVILNGKPTKETLAIVDGVVNECRAKLNQSKARLETARGKLLPLYKNIREKLGAFDKLPEGAGKMETTYIWETVQPLLTEYNGIGKRLQAEVGSIDAIEAQLAPYKDISGLRQQVGIITDEINSYRKRLLSEESNLSLNDFLVVHVIPCIQYRNSEPKRLEEERKKIRERVIALRSMKVEELPEQEFADMQKTLEDEIRRLENKSNQLKMELPKLSDWNVIWDEKEQQSVRDDITMQINEHKKLLEEVSGVLTEMKSQSYFIRIMADARESLQRLTAEFPGMEKKLDELERLDWSKAAADASEAERKKLGVKVDPMRVMTARNRALDGCWVQFDSFIVSLNSKRKTLSDNINRLKNYADNKFSTGEQKRAVLEMGDKLDELRTRIDVLSQKTSAALAQRKEAAWKESQMPERMGDGIIIVDDNNGTIKIPSSSTGLPPQSIRRISPPPRSRTGAGSNRSVPVPDQNGRVILDFVK